MLKTSGWAFSISSKRTTLYGLRRIFSVNWPPSSKPTYPGGEPISLDTVCFSMYSDISSLIIAFSSPNIASASVLQSSVLPTPVGPRKINEPIGLFGFLSPTLPRRIAFAIAETALSWPTTLSCKIFSRLSSLSLSSFVSWLTGIFVQLDTTSAMSSAVTDFTSWEDEFFHLSFSPSSKSWRLFCLSRIFAAFS